MSYKNISITLDETDRQILNILLEDANTAYADIAKRIHVSAGTVHVRMRRLEKLGIANPAFLNINYRKIGYDITAFLRIKVDRAQNALQVLKALEYVGEIVQADLTTGKYNIFSKIICRDTTHLQITLQTIESMENVISIESCLSLQQTINRPIYIKDEYYFEQLLLQEDMSEDEM